MWFSHNFQTNSGLLHVMCTTFHSSLVHASALQLCQDPAIVSAMAHQQQSLPLQQIIWMDVRPEERNQSKWDEPR